MKALKRLFSVLKPKPINIGKCKRISILNLTDKYAIDMNKLH